MQILNIVALALALAMDAFAVALVAGITLGKISLRQNFRLAWHFGLFQAMMPVIGWAAGMTLRSMIARYDHWVAFALLAFVAQGMLRSAFKASNDVEKAKDPTKGATLVVLSIATSLDALAVGLSLSIIHISIWTPALIIGAVAAAFTTLGLHLGKTISHAVIIQRYAEILGALVLLAIGVNILFEHGVFD